MLTSFTAFFDGWNHTFPLYDRAAFEARLAKKYPVTPSDEIAWYASVNIVLAIGWILYPLNMNGSSPLPSAVKSNDIHTQSWWKWFRNAGSTYIDLQFREGSLLAVQSLIGMVISQAHEPTEKRY